MKRWLGPRKLLVHYSIEFDAENSDGGTRPVSADYDIVFSIDEKGHVVAEKATKTKSEN